MRIYFFLVLFVLFLAACDKGVQTPDFDPIAGQTNVSHSMDLTETHSHENSFMYV